MNSGTGRFRWRMAGLMFLITFMSYMDRINLSVATPTIMNEFGFTKLDMGLMQTAFFVGYALMQVPGGIVAEYFGHRRITPLAVTWWSAFTIFTAWAGNLLSFISIRGLFGIGEGPIFPALNIFIYRWFNKAEKALAASFMLGGAFIGPVFGPAITVSLTLAFGWRSVFIIFGLVGFALAALWYYFAPELPRHSSYINKAELEHIEAGMQDVDAKKELAPWKSFLSSSQFWAIGIQYFITDYIMYVFLAWLPLYLMEAQGFSLKKMGIAAAFPWAALCLLTFTAGYLSDRLIASGVSKHNARTWFGISGLVMCCVALYFGAVAKEPWWNVFWLTISLGSLGLTFNASWAACIDIGGKFSGSVSGWMNFWGNVGGVLAPICTAGIATQYGWQAAILFTAATGIVGVIAWLAVKPDVSLLTQLAVKNINNEV